MEQGLRLRGVDNACLLLLLLRAPGVPVLVRPAVVLFYFFSHSLTLPCLPQFTRWDL